MAAVISDASVLISLGSAGHLEILRDLYARVVIPGRISRECVGTSSSLPGAPEIQGALAAQWLVQAEPTNSALVNSLMEKLDAGEAEAIALAVENPGALLLIDESDGRIVAKRFGVPVTGTVGVLVRAKKEGHLTMIRPVLDRMIAGTQFRISQELYEGALRACDEMS